MLCSELHASAITRSSLGARGTTRHLRVYAFKASEVSQPHADHARAYGRRMQQSAMQPRGSAHVCAACARHWLIAADRTVEPRFRAHARRCSLRLRRCYSYAKVCHPPSMCGVGRSGSMGRGSGQARHDRLQMRFNGRSELSAQPRRLLGRMLCCPDGSRLDNRARRRRRGARRRSSRARAIGYHLLEQDHRLQTQPRVSRCGCPSGPHMANASRDGPPNSTVWRSHQFSGQSGRATVGRSDRRRPAASCRAAARSSAGCAPRSRPRRSV